MQKMIETQIPRDVEIEIHLTMEEALDVMLCAQERSMDPRELIREAILNDLYR